MARCIFHIDLDAFFVSVEQALNPELKENLI
jgi:nucleotidyltransferase/DNA polymerase involved in DNA repair